MDALPTEILVKIFSNLPNAVDHCRLLRVNSRFRIILFKYTKGLIYLGSKITAGFITWCRNYRNLEELNLPSGFRGMLSGAQELTGLLQLPRIKQINWSGKHIPISFLPDDCAALFYNSGRVRLDRSGNKNFPGLAVRYFSGMMEIRNSPGDNWDNFCLIRDSSLLPNDRKVRVIKLSQPGLLLPVICRVDNRVNKIWGIISPTEFCAAIIQFPLVEEYSVIVRGTDNLPNFIAAVKSRPDVKVNIVLDVEDPRPEVNYYLVNANWKSIIGNNVSFSTSWHQQTFGPPIHLFWRQNNEWVREMIPEDCQEYQETYLKRIREEGHDCWSLKKRIREYMGE